jgi:cytochrome c oxidase subunit 1
MFSAAGLFFMILGNLLFSRRKEAPGIEFPVSEPLHANEPRIPILNNFKPWLVVMLIVIVLAYLPAFLNVDSFTGDKAPPYDPNSPAPLELDQKSE